jgi:small subunit ribosomal protein S21
MVAPKEFDKSWVRPIEVVVEGSSREDFEYAARRFKTLFQRERVIGQLKERSAYEKPSIKKRRKSREAIARRLMAERRDQMMKSGEWDHSQKQKAQKRILKEEKSAGVIDD